MPDVVSGLRLFLGPEGERYSFSVRYSARFRPYNANVRKHGSLLVFSLGREWAGVSDEIVLGLLQSLASRVLGLKQESLNIDLYVNFVKSLHLSAGRSGSDPFLEESFRRVNERYFSGLIDMPGFSWHDSIRRLASYDYHTDTVSVSRVFMERPDIVDYLMYHELLHKKLKFSSKSERTVHHGRDFRELEHGFENRDFLEREIGMVLKATQKFKYRPFFFRTRES
ncbi:hypothetical protein HY640_01400 [Candidatus Woesearchaeota archaeon]|nr:hypothetical protein [Candidatus Woesearchaeota archaeon]